MQRRLILIGFVFAIALGLMFLKNKLLVGNQELQAEVQLVDVPAPPAGAPPAERLYDVEFRDLAGNKVDASNLELEQLARRLKGSEPSAAVKVKDSGSITADHKIRLVLNAGGDEITLRSAMQGKPFRRSNPTRDFYHLTLGIDLQGGVEFICQLYDESGKQVSADEETMHILRNRLDERGLTEPAVTRLSNGDVQVVIPGGSTADAARTRKVLETTGRLEFREVLDDYGRGAHDTKYPGDKPGEPDCAVVPKTNGGYDFAPGVYHNRGDIVAPLKTEPGSRPTRWVRCSNPPALTGKDVADAYPSMDQGQLAVGIKFTSTGGALNDAFTRSVKAKGDARNGTGRIAILFDGIVQTDPVIREPSVGSCQISGRFTSEEVESLRTVLKGGSLSVTPVVISQRQVGATLGGQTVATALTAMIWSFALIVVFMAWYYRRLGVVANACLVVTAALIWSTLTIFDATVTLPGLAGLVLTIGMAVDTNILFFERIREELRDKHTDLHTAIGAGYDRAFWTIFDAHLTTLVTALVLYWIGSGPVKGFGLSLTIGIVVNLFSGYYVGRLITEWLCRKEQTVKMSSWVPELRLPYVKMRHIGYALSIITGVAGAGWFIFGHYARGGSFERNFDIDFTGGSMAQVIFKEPRTQDQVSASTAAAYHQDAKAHGLLNPAELRIQPYVGGLGVAAGACREWQFRVRDEEGSLIEGERAELELKHIALLRQAALARDKSDEAGARKAEAEAAPVMQEIKERQNRIAHRSEDFKHQLADAFAGLIAPEGEEVVKAEWKDKELSIELATLAKTDADQLGEVVATMHKHDELAALKLEPTAETGMRVRAVYRELPAAAAEFDRTDPVAQRLYTLLTADGLSKEQINGRAHSAFELYEAVVNQAAKKNITVARPYPATEHFSGQVAGQMKLRALAAVLISLVAILAYVAARFEFSFGMGAIIALFHDVVLTVGLCSLLDIRIDLTVVASVLTLIGYSINDTIVTFDRIRENLRKMVGASLSDVIDLSIAQTMPRTVLTTGTVILVVTILLLFGGDALKPFSGSLLIGLISGTYSSIFVAAPLLLAFSTKGGLTPPPAVAANPALIGESGEAVIAG